MWWREYRTLTLQLLKRTGKLRARLDRECCSQVSIYERFLNYFSRTLYLIISLVSLRMWIRWSFLVLSRSRRHWRFPSQIGLFPAQHWNRPVISICHEWSQLPLPVCTRRDPAVTETLLCRRSGLGSAVLHSTQQANCQQQTIWGYIGNLFTYNLCWSKDTTSDTYCQCV